MGTVDVSSDEPFSDSGGTTNNAIGCATGGKDMPGQGRPASYTLQQTIVSTGRSANDRFGVPLYRGAVSQA